MPHDRQNEPPAWDYGMRSIVRQQAARSGILPDWHEDLNEEPEEETEEESEN